MKTYPYTKRAIFLTGATGVLGSRLIPILFREHKRPFILLMRAKDPMHLRERFKTLKDFWGRLPHFDSAFLEDLERHIILMKGDITLQQFGIDKSDYQYLVSHVSNIVHCAGNVRLNMSIEEARLAAVTPAKSLVQLWRDAISTQGSSGIIKVDYVSTVGVAGKKTGLIHEAWQEDVPGYHNTYEQAKAEAEMYLSKAFEEGSVPFTVHRPSMIVGDSETGEIIRFQVFYYLCDFLSGMFTFGVLPKIDGFKLDIIPVDFVAKAISKSLGDERTIGRIFHLSSGESHSVDLMTLATMVAKIYNKLGYSRQNRLIFINLGLFVILLKSISFFSSRDLKKRLATLPYFFDYLSEKQVFDNCNARDILMSGCDFSVLKKQSFFFKLIKRYIAQK